MGHRTGHIQTNFFLPGTLGHLPGALMSLFCTTDCAVGGIKSHSILYTPANLVATYRSMFLKVRSCLSKEVSMERVWNSMRAIGVIERFKRHGVQEQEVTSTFHAIVSDRN